MLAQTTKTDKIIDQTNIESVVISRRYSRLQRTQHWGNAISMIFFFITGIEIYIGIYPIFEYKTIQTFHVYLGLFIVFWSVIFYLFIFTIEKKFKDVIPTPSDFLDLITILLCAFKILPDSKYPHYDFYDPKKKKYVMKYHPTQKILATGNFIMLIFIAITGFALYENLSPGSLGSLGTTSLDMLTPLIDRDINIRFLHFVIFLYFLCGTSVHFYFTMLPQNRGRLRGMATGKEIINHPNIEVETSEEGLT